MATEICPYADSCMIYKNWAELAGEQRIDIIQKDDKYYCLALIGLSLQSSAINKKSITVNERVRKRINLGDVFKKNVRCSHITLLNLLANIKNGN